MPQILIIDDDADFNGLLRDIFEQSGYDVHTEQNPEKGFDTFKQLSFDLVVTDQKMPGLTGDQLIRKMKEIHPEVPIIMVSGFLDNETIRSLIREGVGGVFLKPLNVFSLLKRASSLIDESSKAHIREEHTSRGLAQPQDYEHLLPFEFHTFPCKAEASREFATRLYELRDFKNNLLIVGGKGHDFDMLARDLTSFETDDSDYFQRLQTEDVDLSTLIQSSHDARQQQASRMTLIIAHPNLLDTSQREFLYMASRRQGAFEELEIPVRFMFFLSDDIDSLYDRGELSDDLYMFLGTMELRMPALREIPDDVPIMMHRAMRDYCEAEGRTECPTYDNRAKIYLREREWLGNTMELRSFARELVALNKHEITREDLQAIEQRMNLGQSAMGQLDLEQELRALQQDYCQAVILLSGGRETAATLLQVPEALLPQKEPS